MQRLLLNALRITQSIGIWNQLRPRSQYVGERSHDLNRSASGKREYPLQRPCRLKVCGDRRDYQWTDCRLRRLPGLYPASCSDRRAGEAAGTEGIELLPRFLRA